MDGTILRLIDEQRTYGFRVGDRVRKRSGYAFDSFVVSVFKNRVGDVRLVCESILIPGMLHIFSPQQMDHLDDIGAETLL